VKKTEEKKEQEKRKEIIVAPLCMYCGAVRRGAAR
jgi:hypothetical protein